jgi:PAS domain S-box-containing protein
VEAEDQVQASSPMFLWESLLSDSERESLVLRRPPGVAPVSPSRSIEVLEAMVEGSRDGLWILTDKQVILNANRVAVQFFGIRKEDVIGREVRDLALGAGMDWSIIAEVVSRRVAVTALQTLPDGRKLLTSGTPIFAGDGKLLYVVLTVRDITAVRRLMARLDETTEISQKYRSELRKVELREVQAGEIVAKSEVMRAVLDKAVQYAAVDSPVLILGETGTGKGVFAKLVHQASSRTAGPFLEVNCGAIPEGLIEPELFGYVRGAFTGADSKGKVGLVELAHGGSLLLNEIGDLPLGLQVKLLKFLEDGEVWPVGGVKAKRPDVRIIAATNRDLAGMSTGGTFRKDLFYRLNVLSIQLPPLREHPQDVPWLVAMMISQLEKKLGRRTRIEPPAMDLIARYSFPGNIRELWNLVERLIVTTPRESIGVADLPVEISQGAELSAGTLLETGGTLQKALDKVEAAMLKEALARYGTQAAAAQHLGVAQSTIARKLKQYGL